MKYFGYGYIKDKAQVVPPIAVNFWAFRIMVGVGCLLIAYFALLLVLTFKVPFLSDFTRRLLAALRILPKTAAGGNDVTNLPAWHYWLAIILIPLAYIGSESGWLVAEFGRQPWTIQDMLPTWVAVSDLHASSVMLTFFIFLVLFTTMLAVEIRILLKQIKKGPDCE
jgi:cytochrome d ubiquinol oxidase subunit I